MNSDSMAFLSGGMDTFREDLFFGFVRFFFECRTINLESRLGRNRLL